MIDGPAPGTFVLLIHDNDEHAITAGSCWSERRVRGAISERGAKTGIAWRSDTGCSYYGT
jgi:hypothetical protein